MADGGGGKKCERANRQQFTLCFLRAEGCGKTFFIDFFPAGRIMAGKLLEQNSKKRMNMKKVMLGLAALALVVSAVQAAEEEAQEAQNYSVEVSADVFSAYVSRGTVCNDEPVFQPNLYVEMPAGFDFNLWATMDMTDNDKSCAPDTKGRWSEFDFTLGWNAILPEDCPVALWVGSTFYTYPQFEDDKDYDAAIKLSGNCILSPWIRLVHECDKSDDVRIDFGVSHSIDLADALSLGLSAECTYGTDGWMEKWSRDGSDEIEGVEGGDAGLVDVMVMASLGWQITDNWSAALKGGYSTYIDDQPRDAADYDGIKKDIFYGGVSTAFSF